MNFQGRDKLIFYMPVRPSVRPTVSTKKHRCNWRIFYNFFSNTHMCLGVPSIDLFFVLSYLIKYVHKSIISDFCIFGIHRVIFFKLEPSNFVHFENLSCS